MNGTNNKSPNQNNAASYDEIVEMENHDSNSDEIAGVAMEEDEEIAGVTAQEDNGIAEMAIHDHNENVDMAIHHISTS